jgi:chitinase
MNPLFFLIANHANTSKAPDMPGIPGGKDSDAPNYLAFLRQLRRLLPARFTISITAPASYWYLKAFPIAEMAETIDYIVYMTYDLHCQWDYGNHWASPGCLMGNCLRSHGWRFDSYVFTLY